MLKTDREFRDFAPPLSADERAALESAIARDGGAHDPIITWRGYVVDGHNRYEICQRLGLGYATRELGRPSRDAVLTWIYEHQIARRNLSRDQQIAWAALRDVPYAHPSLMTWGYATQMATTDAGRELLSKVLRGVTSVAIAWNDYSRATCTTTRARTRRSPVKIALDAAMRLSPTDYEQFRAELAEWEASQ